MKPEPHKPLELNDLNIHLPAHPRPMSPGWRAFWILAAIMVVAGVMVGMSH